MVAEGMPTDAILEADVAINLATAELEFYIVVEAHDSREAFAIAYTLQDRAMAEANVAVKWNEAHARRGRPRAGVTRTDEECGGRSESATSRKASSP